MLCQMRFPSFRTESTVFQLQRLQLDLCVWASTPRKPVMSGSVRHVPGGGPVSGVPERSLNMPMVPNVYSYHQLGLHGRHHKRRAQISPPKPPSRSRRRIGAPNTVSTANFSAARKTRTTPTSHLAYMCAVAEFQ